MTASLRARQRAGGDVAGLLQALAVGVVLAGVAALRLHNQWPVALDLSVFDQGLWKLSTGRAPDVTIIGDNLFADHLSPVLLLFVPLYKVAATPYWLVVIQGLVMGTTVLPMRALAGDQGLPRWVGTAAVATSAPFLAAALFDFHPITLATPAIAWAVLSATRDDRRQLTMAIILIALIRADIVWVLVGIAIIAAPACRRRIAIVVPPILVVAVLAPSVLGTSRQRFDRIYPTLGSGPVDALTHPWNVLTTLVSEPALKTLFLWLLPIGFIIVARWRWFAAVFVAGLPFLLSSIPGISEPWYYYGAVFTPIALAGAMTVVGDTALRRFRPFTAGAWIVGAVIALAVASPLAGGAPASLQLARVVTPREVPGWDDALRQIGPDERLAADFDLLAPAAHRDQAYIYPCPYEDFPGEEVCVRARAESTKVDVVLTRAGNRAALEQRGFTVQPVPNSDLIIGRAARPAP